MKVRHVDRDQPVELGELGLALPPPRHATRQAADRDLDEAEHARLASCTGCGRKAPR